MPTVGCQNFGICRDADKSAAKRSHNGATRKFREPAAFKSSGQVD
jgi:hypothetical protein